MPYKDIFKDVRQEGLSSYLRGLPRDKNPYTTPTMQRLWWEGWDWQAGEGVRKVYDRSKEALDYAEGQGRR